MLQGLFLLFRQYFAKIRLNINYLAIVHLQLLTKYSICDNINHHRTRQYIIHDSAGTTSMGLFTKDFPGFKRLGASLKIISCLQGYG